MGDQQTGQYRMYTCRDCGAEFSTAYHEKARGAAVPRVCPECLAEHRRENASRYKARKQSQTAHKAMLARLAARDAEYERGNYPQVVVRVSNGLRIETRGHVAGSVRSC